MRPVQRRTLRLEDVIGVVTEPPQHKIVWEVGGKAPCILSVDVRLMLMVSFMPCQLKPL